MTLTSKSSSGRPDVGVGTGAAILERYPDAGVALDATRFYYFVAFDDLDDGSLNVSESFASEEEANAALEHKLGALRGRIAPN